VLNTCLLTRKKDVDLLSKTRELTHKILDYFKRKAENKEIILLLKNFRIQLLLRVVLEANRPTEKRGSTLFASARKSLHKKTTEMFVKI
jgi:hypothetical protein